MDVKICGLTDKLALSAACKGGARYVGFVFFPKSPRHVTIEQAAELALSVPEGVCKVALVVDPDDSLLDNITDRVPIDMLQLHGKEPPDRVAEIKARYGLPVMKAVGISDVEDLPQINKYSRVADQLLIDAKPPKSAELPGGNGLSFDWRLLEQRRWAVPWMLAGGLTAANVGEAARLTGAQQVDVSSGVESETGVKDADLVEAFLRAARA